MKKVLDLVTTVLEWIFKALCWVVYELTGARWVWEHVWPPKEDEKKERRPAPTITIWVAGVYTALFGLASARYEHAVDRVETRAGAVVALLANDKVRGNAAAQVALIQEREVPKRPEYGTFFIDSFWKWQPYLEGIELLKTAVESCKKELREANLTGSNLAGANLAGGNLREANLQEANLLEADMQGATLEQANLQGATLERANLRGATLERAKLQMTKLHGVDLYQADLQEVKLQGADLQRANLQWVKLQGADLQRAKLQRSKLQLADLQNIRWRRIKSIKGANITAVKNPPDGFIKWALEHGAVFNKDEFNQTVLTSADLRWVYLQGANLQTSLLHGADMQGANLKETNLKGTFLNRTNLAKADMQSADLRGAVLEKANLQEANLKGIQNWKEIRSVVGANITGVKNTPDGFIEWALEHGAVIDEDPAKEEDQD